MRTLKFLLLGLLLTTAYSQAQVSVSVNIESPPAWGVPVQAEVRYYYLPEIETYYDLSTRHYIYVNDGRWVRTANLPVVYRNYNLYRGPKVVVENYCGREPYSYYKPYKEKHHKHHKKHHKHHYEDEHYRGRRY